MDENGSSAHTTDPARIHGYGQERFLRPIEWRHPRGGHRADAACPNIRLSEIADRRDLPEPLNLHPFGQPHDQRPSVIEMPRPMDVVVRGSKTDQVAGRATRLLQERNIGFAPLRHFGQLPPRIVPLGDVPAHDPGDHAAVHSAQDMEIVLCPEGAVLPVRFVRICLPPCFAISVLIIPRQLPRRSGAFSCAVHGQLPVQFMLSLTRGSKESAETARAAAREGRSRARPERAFSARGRGRRAGTISGSVSVSMPPLRRQIAQPLAALPPQGSTCRRRGLTPTRGRGRSRRPHPCRRM